MKHFIWLLFLLSVASCSDDDNKTNPTADNEIDETVRINEIQIIGSHNSYRKKTYQPIFDFVQGIKNLLPQDLDPDGWDYSHPVLEMQLGTYKVRGLELDIYPDPDGGHYFNRGGNSLVGEPIASGIDELNQPGFKIIHIPDLDYQTNYYSFKSALTALKNWSNANPKHLPIFVNIETKSSVPSSSLSLPNFVTEIPYTAEMVALLDAEVIEIFGADLAQVLTPDKLRGSFNTLNEVVAARQLPLLKEARGKIIFIMEGALTSLYIQSSPSLRGRTMFVYSDPGKDETVFVEHNSSVNEEAEILKDLADGYMIRTRADADTREARIGDFSSMNAAFRSGAHIISTDYYKPDERAGQAGWTNYQVIFPDNSTARINPVSAQDKIELGKLNE